MTENTIDASIVDDVQALLAADRAGAAPLPASNQYADVVRAVARARLALKSRPTRGAIYAKIRGELDAPHVLLRAPLRRPSGTPSPERGSPPGRRRRLPPSATPGREAALRRGGAAVAVPEFLAALLDLADCAFTKLFLARPECFLFCSDFLVMPNPGYVDVAALAAGLAPRDFARAAERSRKGFGLVAWWIHPELRKRSRFFHCHADLRLASRLARRGAPPAAAAAAPPPPRAPPPPPRAGARSPQPTVVAPSRASPPTPPSPPRDASQSKAPAITVGALLAAAGDAAPYLYDDSDLRAPHAPGLRALEAAVADHVRAVYGHAAARTLGPDDVYFHRQRAMWSAPERSWSMTAHVHVAVGRARPPACHCHSVSLRAVVARLEAPGETDEPRPPRLELLNLPADAADLARARRRLADAGFRLSRCLSPADLSFDDLAAYEP